MVGCCDRLAAAAGAVVGVLVVEFVAAAASEEGFVAWALEFSLMQLLEIEKSLAKMVIVKVA